MLVLLLDPSNQALGGGERDFYSGGVTQIQ